jgi:predicted dehydrogenase
MARRATSGCRVHPATRRWCNSPSKERGKEKTFRPLELPASYRAGWPEDVEPGIVARLYARMAQDLRDGTRTAPRFEDAIAVHRIIAAIEKATESGSRTAPRSIT